MAHSLTLVGGKLSLTEPRTERSRRTLVLPGVVAASRRDHRRRQLEERLEAGPRWQDLGYVFATPTGGPLHARNVLRAFHLALTAAGLPSVTFHSLRHSAASFLLASGAPLKVTSEVLGHSQLATTADLYGHLFEEAKQRKPPTAWTGS